MKTPNGAKEHVTDGFKEGDANSIFFHKVANERKKHNQILEINIGGQVLSDPDILKPTNDFQAAVPHLFRL